MTIRHARLGRAVIDGTVLYVAWIVGYILRYDVPWPAFVDYQLIYGVPFAVLLQFAVLRGIGTHRESWRHTSVRESTHVVQALLLAAALIVAARWLVPAFTAAFPRAAYLHLPRGVLAIQTMTATLGLLGVRLLRRLHVQYLETGRAFVAGTRTVLLVGAGRTGVRVAREYHDRPDLRVRIAGFLDDDLGIQGMLVAGVPVLGRIDDLEDAVQSHWPDEVMITLPDPTPQEIHRVVSLCERAGVSAHVPPAFATEPTGLTGPIDLTEVSRVALPVDLPQARTTADLVHDVTKRTIDLVLGTALAVLLTPLVVVLAVAMAITLRTTRPFFVQDRIGRYGRLFRFPKIRTLPPEAPAYALKPAVQEMQLPWLSRTLRALHLDELPQLYLVVLGQMSLVGPRPKMPDDNEPVEVGYATARTLVPQGCTCLWQVGAHTDALPSDSPDYDFYYLQHHSIRMDLWILWRTALQVIGIGTEVHLDRMPAWLARGSGTPIGDLDQPTGSASRPAPADTSSPAARS